MDKNQADFEAPTGKSRRIGASGAPPKTGNVVIVGPWAYTTRSVVWRTLDGETWTRVGHRSLPAWGAARHVLGRAYAVTGVPDAIDVSLATGVI